MGSWSAEPKRSGESVGALVLLWAVYSISISIESARAQSPLLASLIIASICMIARSLVGSPPKKKVARAVVHSLMKVVSGLPYFNQSFRSLTFERLQLRSTSALSLPSLVDVCVVWESQRHKGSRSKSRRYAS